VHYGHTHIDDWRRVGTGKGGCIGRLTRTPVIYRMVI
jgi:hypothetical protein